MTTDKRPQDRGGGVRDMTGNRGAGRQVLHLEDDMGGEELQGAAAAAAAMSGVREGIDKGVTGDAPPNPARRGERGVGVRGRQSRRGRRSQNL